jgi:hypothetical protein
MQGTEKETPSTGKEATPKSEGLRTEAKPKIKQNCQLIDAVSTNLAVKGEGGDFQVGNYNTQISES